jgi:hypothetical protein
MVAQAHRRLDLLEATALGSDIELARTQTSDVRHVTALGPSILVIVLRGGEQDERPGDVLARQADGRVRLPECRDKGPDVIRARRYPPCHRIADQPGQATESIDRHRHSPGQACKRAGPSLRRGHERNPGRTYPDGFWRRARCTPCGDAAAGKCDCTSADPVAVEPCTAGVSCMETHRPADSNRDSAPDYIGPACVAGSRHNERDRSSLPGHKSDRTGFEPPCCGPSGCGCGKPRHTIVL